MRVKNIKIFDKGRAQFYMRHVQERVTIISPSIQFISHGLRIQVDHFSPDDLQGIQRIERRMSLKEYFFLHQLLFKWPQELKRFLGK